MFIKKLYDIILDEKGDFDQSHITMKTLLGAFKSSDFVKLLEKYPERASRNYLNLSTLFMKVKDKKKALFIISLLLEDAEKKSKGQISTSNIIDNLCDLNKGNFWEDIPLEVLSRAFKHSRSDIFYYIRGTVENKQVLYEIIMDEKLSNEEYAMISKGGHSLKITGELYQICKKYSPQTPVKFELMTSLANNKILNAKLAKLINEGFICRSNLWLFLKYGEQCIPLLKLYSCRKVETYFEAKSKGLDLKKEIGLESDFIELKTCLEWFSAGLLKKFKKYRPLFNSTGYNSINISTLRYNLEENGIDLEDRFKYISESKLLFNVKFAITVIEDAKYKDDIFLSKAEKAYSSIFKMNSNEKLILSFIEVFKNNETDNSLNMKILLDPKIENERKIKYITSLQEGYDISEHIKIAEPKLNLIMNAVYNEIEIPVEVNKKMSVRQMAMFFEAIKNGYDTHKLLNSFCYKSAKASNRTSYDYPDMEKLFKDERESNKLAFKKQLESYLSTQKTQLF